MNRSLAISVSAAVAMLCVQSDLSAREPRRPRMDRFFQMLDALISAPKLDRQTVEQTLGVRLDELHRYTDRDPREYVGRNVQADDIAIKSVKLRQGPVLGSMQESRMGSSLALTISSGCIKSADIRGHYKDLSNEVIVVVGGQGGYLFEEGPRGGLDFEFEYGCLYRVGLTRPEPSSANEEVR